MDQVVCENNIIYYPHDKVLDDYDINLMNENMSSSIKIVKKEDKFLTTKFIKEKENKQKIEKKRLSIIKEFLLSLKFLKNKVFGIALSSFMVSAIMVILALAQTIITFDSGSILENEMKNNNQNSLLLTKMIDNELFEGNAKYYKYIDENDIEYFYNKGYNGKIYPVYNYSLADNYSSNYSFNNDSIFKGLYLRKTIGHMIVDSEFLNEKFGEFSFVAEAKTQKNCGVIITDYTADCLLKLNSNYAKDSTYEDLLGEYRPKDKENYRVYINAIINTNYKEEYYDFINMIKKNPNITSQELYNNEEFKRFYSDVFDKLGYSFSLNDNFFEELYKSTMVLYPSHDVLLFNDLIEYKSISAPYLTSSLMEPQLGKYSEEYISDIWRYTSKNPEIPEGAKYIRVSFNEACDSVYGVQNEVVSSDYAILRFNNEDRISKEVMTKYHGTNELGIYLDSHSGELIYDSRGLAHTTVSDFIEIPQGAQITEFGAITKNGLPYCAFYDENKNYISSVSASYGIQLPEKTVYMSYTKYNEVFNTSYSLSNLDKFIPHKVKLTHYTYDGDKNNSLFDVEVTIVGLLDSKPTFVASSDVIELFQMNQYKPLSLYFNGINGMDNILNEASNLNYEYQAYALEAVHTMTKAVDVFIPIFELIAIVLCVGIIFILVSFSTKMIKNKMHDIGILKALGTQNKSIVVVFGLQIILISLTTIIMSTIGYYFFIDLANDVLIASLKQSASGYVILDLDFLTFKLNVVGINTLLIVILSIVSLIIPMIKIKNIKPVKIIKTKE